MRGLLTIEPLYHKSVAGLKTQTRRSGGLRVVNCKPDLWHLMEFNGEVATFLFNYSKQRNPDHLMRATCKPRYKIGEVMYLKEPYCKALNHGLTPNGVLYKFGVPDGYVANVFGRQVGSNSTVKWQNKMFMGAKAARAFIRITGIKCERLLDISHEDSKAEGIELFPAETHRFVDYQNDNRVCNPRESFISLFKFANKMSPAAEVPNLWVWAYTYEYLKDYKL